MGRSALKLMIYLVSLLFLCHVVVAQVVMHPRPQPEVLNARSVATCCGTQGEALHACVKALNPHHEHSHAHSNASSKEVYIVTLARKSVFRGASAAETDPVANAPGLDFTIHGITDFRGYQGALLAAYAEHQGYTLMLKDEGNSAPLQPGDPRWDKVKLLLDIMEGAAAAPTGSGGQQAARFVLWVDSDAAVLDLGFSVEETLQSQYPRAQLLVSADVKMGLINSGVLLLRNSPFARRFLRQWWGVSGDEAADEAVRGQYCDQLAFDRLLTRYVQVEALVRRWRSISVPTSRACLPPTLFQLAIAIQEQDSKRGEGSDQLLPLPDINTLLDLAEYYDALLLLWKTPLETGGNLVPLSEIFRILRPSAVNSHPPAMFFQGPESQFVHLMGESDRYRARVFGAAWGTVCAHLGAREASPALASRDDSLGSRVDSPVELPVQLGCNQPMLLQWAAEVYAEGVETALRGLEAAMAASGVANGAGAVRAVVAAGGALQRQAHHLFDIHAFQAHAGPITGPSAGPVGTAAAAAAHLARSPREELMRRLRRWRAGALAGSDDVPVQGRGVDDEEAHLEAAYQLRRRIFGLFLGYRLRVQGWVRALARQGQTTVLDEAGERRWRQELVAMKYAYLGVIQLAAEAGNDYFCSSRNYTEQAAVADTVQQSLLSELTVMVRGSSKGVPLHMRGLMSHSTALVYYQQWLMRAEEAPGGDNEAGLLALALAQATEAVAAFEQSHLHNLEVDIGNMAPGSRSEAGTEPGMRASVSTAQEYIYSLLLRALLQTLSSRARPPLSQMDAMWNLTIIRAHRWLPHGVSRADMLYRVQIGDPNPDSAASLKSLTPEGVVATSTLSLVLMTNIYYYASLSYTNRHRYFVRGGGGPGAVAAGGVCAGAWELVVAQEYVARAQWYLDVARRRGALGEHSSGTHTDADRGASSAFNMDLNQQLLVYPGGLHGALTAGELTALGEYIQRAREGYPRSCPVNRQNSEVDVDTQRSENAVGEEEDDEEWEECLPGDEDCEPYFDDEEDEDEDREAAWGLEQVVLVGLPQQQRRPLPLAAASAPLVMAEVSVVAHEGLAGRSVRVAVSQLPESQPQPQFSRQEDGEDEEEDDDEDEEDEELLAIQQRYSRQTGTGGGDEGS